MPRDGEKKVTKLSVDLSGVPERREGGRAARVPEGDYILKLKDAYFTKVKAGSKNAGQPQAVWVFEIAQPSKYKSAGSIFYRTGMWPDALFSFRNILQDLLNGKEIPKKVHTIDLTKYIGKEVGATLADGDEYNGKIRSEIVNTFPASKYSEAEASDDEDDEDADETDDEDELETSDDGDEDESDDEDDEL